MCRCLIRAVPCGIGTSRFVCSAVRGGFSIARGNACQSMITVISGAQLEPVLHAMLAIFLMQDHAFKATLFARLRVPAVPALLAILDIFSTTEVAFQSVSWLTWPFTTHSAAPNALLLSAKPLETAVQFPSNLDVFAAFISILFHLFIYIQTYKYIHALISTPPYITNLSTSLCDSSPLLGGRWPSMKLFLQCWFIFFTFLVNGGALSYKFDLNYQGVISEKVKKMEKKIYKCIFRVQKRSFRSETF